MPAALARFPATVHGTAWRQRAADVLAAPARGAARARRRRDRYVLGEPPEVTDRSAAANRLHARTAAAAYRAITGTGALCRPPRAGFQLYPTRRRAPTRRGGPGGTPRHALGRHVVGGHRFGDDPAEPRVRIDTGALHGRTESERRTTLNAADPLTVPHVAAALEALSAAFTATAVPATEQPATATAEPPADPPLNSRIARPPPPTGLSSGRDRARPAGPAGPRGRSERAGLGPRRPTSRGAVPGRARSHARPPQPLPAAASATRPRAAAAPGPADGQRRWPRTFADRLTDPLPMPGVRDVVRPYGSTRCARPRTPPGPAAAAGDAGTAARRRTRHGERDLGRARELGDQDRRADRAHRPGLVAPHPRRTRADHPGRRAVGERCRRSTPW